MRPFCAPIRMEKCRDITTEKKRVYGKESEYKTSNWHASKKNKKTKKNIEVWK